MPNYVSKDGVFYPANEKVGLVDHKGTDGRQPGDPYVYVGPDRAALFELYKAGVETFGVDFHHDAELLHRVKQLGFNNVDEYAKTVGYDKKKVEEEFTKKASVVNKHEIPKKVEAIKIMGGGMDSSGQGNEKHGGFGQPKELE